MPLLLVCLEIFCSARLRWGPEAALALQQYSNWRMTLSLCRRTQLLEFRVRHTPVVVRVRNLHDCVQRVLGDSFGVAWTRTQPQRGVAAGTANNTMTCRIVLFALR